MKGEAEGAECAIRAVKAIHITLAFVRISMMLALNEKARREERPQPWRPPVLILSSLSSHGFPVLLQLLEGGILIDRQLFVQRASSGL